MMMGEAFVKGGVMTQAQAAEVAVLAQFELDHEVHDAIFKAMYGTDADNVQAQADIVARMGQASFDVTARVKEAVLAFHEGYATRAVYRATHTNDAQVSAIWNPIAFRHLSQLSLEKANYILAVKGVTAETAGL